MKDISAIFRLVFISPECLIIVGGLAMVYAFPQECIWLSQRIGQQPEVLKYSWLLPAGLFGYDVKIVKSIVFPDADKNTLLQKWERYGELKYATMVGLVYGFGFSVAGVVAMLLDWKAPGAHHSATLLVAVIGALVVSITFFLAQIRIEELFREHMGRKSGG